MNKTVTINLGGTIFNVEEDAFDLLKAYLESIRRNFSGDESAGEIMDDIERRIAELFTQRMDEKKNVVVSIDVEEVIAIMGQPEDYGTTTENANSSEGTSYVKHDKRRIYRDQDDAYIGGVCSGLSYYLGWDPILLRIGFIILTFAGGSGIPAYIILWAVVPLAGTTAEKLRMRGEPINVENIGKFVNQEARTAQENLNRFGDKAKKSFSGMRHNSSDFGNVLRKIVGLVFILFSITLLIGLVTGTFIANFEIIGNTVNFEIFNTIIFQNDGTIWMLLVGALLVTLMPILSILYAGIRLLVDRGRRVKGIGWSLFALFVIGFIMISIGGFKIGRQFRRGGEITSTTELSIQPGDTLYLDVEEDLIFTGRNYSDGSEFFDLVKIDDTKITYGNPLWLGIYTCDEMETPKLVIQKNARGSSLIEAGERAERIEYPFTLNGNHLVLSPHFTTQVNELYRGQEVEMYLSLPEGTLVKFNKNIGYLNRYRSYSDAVATIGSDGVE